MVVLELLFLDALELLRRSGDFQAADSHLVAGGGGAVLFDLAGGPGCWKSMFPAPVVVDYGARFDSVAGGERSRCARISKCDLLSAAPSLLGTLGGRGVGAGNRAGGLQAGHSKRAGCRRRGVARA